LVNAYFVNLTPFVPLSLKGEGGEFREGLRPLVALTFSSLIRKGGREAG